MARRIEFLDTTLRDGNKLPFVALSPPDRIQLAAQLARLGVDIVEAGFPAASPEEADCVARICAETRGPSISALARALPGDVEKTLEILRRAEKPHLHIFMSLSRPFLSQVLKQTEEQAVDSIRRCVKAGSGAGVRVQFSASEAPHARREFLRECCVTAVDAGADLINLADTNGILAPEEMAGLVSEVIALFPKGGRKPAVGVHCHNDLGLAAANTLAAIRAGATHVEVTIGGFGERAGNAALEEIAFLISAFGERYDISHGLRLGEIAATSRLFDSMTGIRTHPNKPIIGQCAFLPAAGGFPGKALEPGLRELLREKTIGRVPGGEEKPSAGHRRADEGPCALESFSVLTGSHSTPVGVIVLRRNGAVMTQSSHGNGPIDALFRAMDKALGFSPRLVLYSVSTLSTGSEARTEVIVTVELHGRKFHGRHSSTDVIGASVSAYMMACNAIAASGLLEGQADFHVQGEYLWE